MMSKIDLMRHALGVEQRHDGRWPKPYRNHFCADIDDVLTWDALVAEGLAVRQSAGNAITGGSPLYTVTEPGRAVALAGITFQRKWGYGSTPAEAGTGVASAALLAPEGSHDDETAALGR